MTDDAEPSLFQSWTSENIRYADTDRQGHVNNAIFATFFEIGRVSLVYSPEAQLVAPGTEFVIARLEIDYLAEIGWPGHVAIGTTVASVGRSSLTLNQAIFQGERRVAQAHSVVVLIDQQMRRATPLTAAARECLQQLQARSMPC